MATRISIGTGALTPTPTNPWNISGTVEVGDVVYQVSGADKTVARAKADDAVKRPPMGIVFGKSNGTVLVAGNGDLASGLSGLTTGTVYWLSTTAGQLVDTKPASNAYLVGVATSPTELLVGFTAADLTAGVGSGSGTVTSVGVASADGSLSVSGSPITSSGSVTVDLATVAVADGGTGLTSASEAGAMLVASGSGAYVSQNVSPFQRNRLINGAQMVSQRYADAPIQPSQNAYPTDRWVGGSNMLNSVVFDGSGDYLTVANNAAFDLTQGDFTIEMWVYRTVTGVRQELAEHRSGVAGVGWSFLITATNLVQFFYPGGTSVISTSTVSASTWTHIAATRSGATMRVFVNGVLENSAAAANGTTNTTALYIGTTAGVLNPYTGYISNLRIVKGTALYTANFTPSQVPLTAVANTSLLTCAASTLSDLSTNNFTVTAAGNAAVSTVNPFRNFLAGRMQGWSNYFDGSGDMAYVNGATPLHLSGDFTIETWINPSVNGAVSLANYALVEGVTYYSWNWGLNAAGGTTFTFRSSNAVGTALSIATPTGLIATNTWTHLAVVRNGTSFKIYVNGSEQASGTSSAVPWNAGSTYGIGIGGAFNGSWGGASVIQSFNGYISNLRIIKGTALYTSNFTPLTTPLVPVANTSLLTCASEIFQDKSSNGFTITTVGNTSVSSLNPFTAQAPTGFVASLRWSVTAAASALTSQYAQIQQRVEGTSVYDLAWGTASAKAITLSFWVRSPLTGTYCVAVQNAAQNRSYIVEYTVSAANTWEKKVIAVPGDTSGTWPTTTAECLRVVWDLGSGTTFNGTAGSWLAANDTRTTNQIDFIGTALASGVQSNDFAIAGAQLEMGSVATPFEFRPMQAEVALCQRYYAKLRSLSSAVAFGNGVCGTATTAWIFMKYPVTMRSQPTLNEHNTHLYDAATRTITGISATYSGLDSLQVSIASSSLTPQRGVVWRGDDINAYVQLDAEL